MALFGKSRDISLFNSVNGELINDIIQTEVAYYKFALEQTTSNVYGESMGKNYYEPMKIACLINKDDQTWSSDDFGSDMNQIITFSFLKNELKDINKTKITDVKKSKEFVLVLKINVTSLLTFFNKSFPLIPSIAFNVGIEKNTNTTKPAKKTFK